MQHNKIKTSEWVCAATTFFVSSTLHAGIPPLKVTLSSGPGTNVISIGPGQTATVEYLMQNVVSAKKTWLWASPIPPYITRTASLHQPDCSVYNQDPASPGSFTLPANGSCYFAMEVNGTVLATQPTPASYRPLFTNSGAIAYGPCDPIQASPSTLMGILIAAGRYVSGDEGGAQRPLLVSSRNQGTTWIYPDSIPNIPNTISFDGEGVIRGTSCTGTTCIAAGSGEDTDLNTFPFLAMSQDAALTWSYVVPLSSPVFTPINTHPYGLNGVFNGTSCSANICIAGGSYQESITSTTRPMLALTQNQGLAWSFPASITEPVFVPVDTNPFAGSGVFNAVSCSSPLCIAVGNYVDGVPTTRPLLALTQDAGSTWAYPDDITTVTLVSNPFVDGGIFRGASCSGNTCVAVGSYASVGNVVRPLLAVSSDAGNTWGYSETVTAPLVVPIFQSGEFYSVSCSNATTCVAVGYYNDVSAVTHPLLAVSNDSGASWTFPANISVPVFVPVTTNPFTSGSFNSVSCSGTICIAVGSYADNVQGRPLLAISNDTGATWSYPDVITSPVFVPGNTSPYSNDGIFYTASCNDNTCIAAGDYFSGFLSHPMLVLTTDGGVTWTYPNSITNPVFTPTSTYPYVSEGSFGASTATSGTLLPKRLQFLYQKQR